MLSALIFAVNFCLELLVLFGEVRGRLLLVVALAVVLASWAFVEVVLYARAAQAQSVQRIRVLMFVQLGIECARLALLTWMPQSGVDRLYGFESNHGELGLFLLPLYVLMFLAILRAVLANHTVELRRLATTDALTGVCNRGHLEICFREALAEQNRSKSMILIDIDNFKQINDRLGHRAGDLILREMTKVLAQNLRASDILGRWGGEEFAVLLRDSSATEANGVAEKLRGAISRHDFKVQGMVTASFGVAQAHSGDEFENWFQRADGALYRAKHAGRNSVAMA